MSKWDQIKTKHGYSADEVISALQKSIRRGQVEDAVFFTYEMICTSEELADKYWQRVRVISAEDIGMANPSIVPIIYSLHQNYILLKDKGGDRFLQALEATILLCNSPKSRYLDELYNNLKVKIESEEYRKEIPDYALDKHTKRGEDMGRDAKHFWEVASKIENDTDKDNKSNLDEILSRLK